MVYPHIRYEGPATPASSSPQFIAPSLATMSAVRNTGGV